MFLKSKFDIDLKKTKLISVWRHFTVSYRKVVLYLTVRPPDALWCTVLLNVFKQSIQSVLYLLENLFTIVFTCG